MAAIGIARITGFLKDRESKIQRARQERKAMLDEQAKQARIGFEVMVRSQGRHLIDAAEEHHNRHRSRLRSTLDELVHRINAEDTARSRTIVDRLEPVDEEGRGIVTEIQEFLDLNRTD